MNKTPTVTTYNPSVANANWRDSTGAADRTVTVGDQGDRGFRLDGAAGVAASINYIHCSVDAEI